MSRAEKYADSDDVSLAQAKTQIAQTLRTKRGKQNAISSSALAGMVGIKATTVRDLVPEIRRERNIPIASCPGGYYVIECTDDFRETMRSIEETIETKKQRQRELARAWYHE